MNRNALASLPEVDNNPALPPGFADHSLKNGRHAGNTLDTDRILRKDSTPIILSLYSF